MSLQADDGRTQDSGATGAANLAAKQRRTAMYAGAFALFMLGMAFASVPLYRIFCQVTGFGGTPQRAVAKSEKVLDRTIVVRFDSNVAHGLNWKFKPVQRKMTVKIGENALAFYRATNTSDKPITGTASFNVAPEAAGQHFVKIACFCFTEQTLKPGESVEMPVTFYVDPGLVDDPAASRISEITLSYTFYPASKDKSGETGKAKNQASKPARKSATKS